MIFEATQKYLRCLSQRLGEQPSTGDVQPQSWGGLYLIGNDPNLNIFTFDGTNIEGSGLTLGSINTLNIIAPEGSTILINALVENISFQNYGMFFNGSTISESQNKLIFWNLPNAINLFSSGISIKGTLLAPYATANMNNGNIDGSLIVQNLSGNIEEHYMLFQGCLPEVDCPIVTSIVGDFVWNDINRNGIIDPGETGISGVTATLYNCNGTSTGLSAITDSNGFYYITGVNPGRYYVQFSNLPNNYVFVTAGGFVDINGKTACFDVGVTEFISNIDAPAAFSSTPTASIGDYVWLDKNRNGIVDTGATGIPNVTVTLYKSDGSSTGLSAMTDQDGYYKINGIPPGSYYVVFSGVPTGYEFITANGLVDSSGKSPEFTLTGGQINNTIDAPVAPIRGSIGDLVWNDVNGNGQLDDGEVGVPGVTVTLYNCYADGTLVLPNPSYTAMTDSNGKYTIDNIEPGEYYVIFTTLPPDYNFITAGDYVDKNGKSNCFTINPESNLTNIDAPIAQNPTPASITGLVWNDINRDNIVDSGENGVPGVTVTLYNCDGNPTDISTTTNPNGTYTIANIQPGSYYVVFRNLPDDYEFVSGIYVNSQGRNPSNSSECIVLGDGEIKTDVNAPIAEALTPLASIGDLVWYDLNRNGQYDPGETGVPGVIVTLFYSNGNPTGLSAVTNAAGIYTINNIQPGEYYVIFSNIPNKYDFVVTENSFIDSTGKSDNFTLISNEVNNTIDAPIAPQYATIGDKVIYDTNRNGARDPGELGVPDILVTLYGCTDVDAENPLATAITNSNGIYSIDNIEPGEYYVIFSEIPTDYVFITTNNYTNEKGISSCFDLQPGEINNRIDAFIAIDTPRSAQVGDFVWYDKNRNGIIDANERGVSGVTASLYKADTDELIDTTSTNISGICGIYGITGIPAGQYYIKFSDIPSGYSFFLNLD